jgi:hypothetical protein
MSLRDSPLLNLSLFAEAPYSDWMRLTKSYNECEVLGPALSGIPKPWIEWAERIASSHERRRGDAIRSPLKFRMSVLWNGIVLLQEAKFICDTLENALRQLIAVHCQKHAVKWGQIRWHLRWRASGWSPPARGGLLLGRDPRGRHGAL